MILRTFGALGSLQVGYLAWSALPNEVIATITGGLAAFVLDQKVDQARL